MTGPTSLTPSSPDLSGLTTPTVDQNNPAYIASTQATESQLTADGITNNNVAAQDDALTTANSVRNSIYGTLDGISQQAITAANAQIGEEIQQSKKSIDNAGKAI